MTKEQVASQISLCFVQGLRDVLSMDKELHSVNVIVNLRPNGEKSRRGCVVINFFIKQ